MRLVAVSIVKNEADIIEAFVRHTGYWVDHHLIFDHESTDGTREILQALQREGLAITLYTDESWAHLQQKRSNHLTRLAARDFGADWILPMDADEILVGIDQEDLRNRLASAKADIPLSLRLCDYYPSQQDDPAEINPILRLRFSQQALSQTKKIIIPHLLANDEEVEAVKGSHNLNRGNHLIPDEPLPETYHLAHLALRSPQHQVLRVVVAELHKLSNGRAAEGLDTHYRLGYQLLSENPEMFFDTLCPPSTQLHLNPITYHGDTLSYSQNSAGWNRLARALLPFLDRLATSHGKLVDGEKLGSKADIHIREMTPVTHPSPISSTECERFTGFDGIEGWGETEGPVPEAFLPTFHWGFFPYSQIQISAPSDQIAHFYAEVLTYTEGQSITILLNDHDVGSLSFTRTNQKETLSIPLNLKSGSNTLTLKYTQFLATDYDRRQLAVLFLSLRIS